MRVLVTVPKLAAFSFLFYSCIVTVSSKRNSRKYTKPKQSVTIYSTQMVAITMVTSHLHKYLRSWKTSSDNSLSTS